MVLASRSAPAQGAPVSPARVGEALHAALWAMRTHSTKALAQAGMTPSQAGVVWWLHEYKALSLARLAELQGGSPANLTGIVTRLEREGLVVREPHATDNRVKIIRLTPEGVARTRQARKAIEAATGELFADASPQDLATVLRILTQVKRRAEGENPKA
jgi:DNA-binding MarR family transcriptional regulator